MKLVDQICNARDMLASTPAGWPAERKKAYFAWAVKVVFGIREYAPYIPASKPCSMGFLLDRLNSDEDAVA